jgi:hypothetical protein
MINLIFLNIIIYLIKMRIGVIALTVALFCCARAYAQDTQASAIHYQFISKDSVKLSLNEDFELIGDSCATIYRYARLDTALGKFTGHVKDVSRADPNLVITDGTYDQQGNKQGLFVSNFLNGKIESKGSFVNDKFDGKWELYYDNGKPRMNFEVHGNDMQLNDYWDISGAKIVNNGRGKYKFEVGQIYWEGNLLNGRPAGTWFAYKNDGKDGSAIMVEIYKLGVFQVGKSPSGKEYKDTTRMELLSQDLLPFTRAEKLTPSSIPCGVKASNIVHPQYVDGIDVYNSQLSDEVKQALRATDLKRIGNKKFSVTGQVDGKGYLTNLQAIDAFDKVLADKLILALKRLPPLLPVVVNGRIVKVDMNISFIFSDGFCNFNYAFTAADH